jgi:hypothetical protein
MLDSRFRGNDSIEARNRFPLVTEVAFYFALRLTPTFFLGNYLCFFLPSNGKSAHSPMPE